MRIFNERTGNVYENKGVGKNVMPGADDASEQLRGAEGAVQSQCADCRDVSLCVKKSESHVIPSAHGPVVRPWR